MSVFLALQTTAEEVLSSLGVSNTDSLKWVRPQQSDYGDMSTPVALAVAKAAGKAPREIAEALCQAFSAVEGIERVEVAGPGYVNLWLTPSALLSRLSEVERACEPVPPREGEAPVIVEYSQPNIAKPLGIHHIIGTVLGQATANLYRHAGYNVICWNYIGDWGTQFGKLAVAYERWGKQKPVLEYSIDELLALYVRFHEEVDNDLSLEDQGREAFRQLEAGDADLRSFWQDVVQITKASLKDVYRRLHVSFDLDLGESFYEGKMEPVLEEGKQKGVFTEGKEGALIVEFPEEKALPPYLVLKGDGATLYSTRDIAQMRYRMDTYQPQKILIFTDIAQKLHFEQLEETCRMLGWDLPHFKNVLFGRMRFVDKSMSTRKGNILNLEHVLEEAVAKAKEAILEHGDAIQTDDADTLSEIMGIGSLVYGILSQNRKMDLVFDWEKMLSFEGNSAPYLQYTYARARSVLRKAEAEGGNGTEVQADTLTSHERDLLNTLLEFPAALEEARATHLPHTLANYLYRLGQVFNSFYNADPILQADPFQRALRLRLTQSVATTLKTGAELLTLRVPERM